MSDNFHHYMQKSQMVLTHVKGTHVIWWC